MRKLLKIQSFRNLMIHFPKQNYCVYRHIRNNDVSVAKVPYKSVSPKTYYFSTLTSQKDITENSFAELNKEFHNPKSILFQILNEAFLRDPSIDLKPSIVTEQLKPDSDNGFIWRAKLQMKWPESFEIEGLANRKADALNICFLQACQKLKQMGVLNYTNKPSLPERKLTEDEIRRAKADLLNLLHHIWHRLGNKKCMPKFNTPLLQGIYGSYWQTELRLSYPEEKVFKAIALRSTNAEGIAAYEALIWLTDKGIINKKRRLVQYSKTEEMKLKENYQDAYSISIPPLLQEKMQTIIADIEEIQKSFPSSKDSTFYAELKEDTSKEIEVRDLITEGPYFKLTDQQFSDRSRYLYDKYKNSDKTHVMAMDEMNTKFLLPVFGKREEILKLIDENQVVILSGDTGCGKSTQVPQFILEHYISNMKGAECNIIVTQPRRISAFSLAERVAFERGEKIGNSVGYQMRLNKCLPGRNGAILYCTTGMLLRKTIFNPTFEGISHIIIDEVHERNIQTDLICILLKEVLKNNKNLKVLLMSASFNTNLFAQYFNSSAIIHVPGKMHTVEEYFLEDLVNKISNLNGIEMKNPNLNVDLIVNTIDHIHEHEPPGAVLCFLPGWNDIRTVHNKLLELEGDSKEFLILPMHSRLPHEEQKNIFMKTPKGQRKIILATNIAETSITINDVVYVVNSGLYKGTRLDTQAGIATLSTKWITKANVRQRKGRAGRVKPGKCYHMFSWKTFMKMEEYPVPEILRMPLETVILDCKLYCPEMKPEEFLSKGLQPPAASAIKMGINELQMLGVLDETESLTTLGKIIVNFSTHPRLSVALTYAAFLGCLDPVLTICALMTIEKEPFVNTLDDKLHMRNVKKLHDNGLCSDHLALMKIYNTWYSLAEDSTSLPGDINASQYCEKNLLDEQILSRLKELKELFAEDLVDSGLIRTPSLCDDYSNHLYNKYSSCVPSILAALSAAFSPNIIKIIQGEINKGKLNKDSLIYSIIKGQNAYIQKESVVSDADELPTPWLIFFSALNSEARRKAMISAVSSVPGICLLLFAGRNIEMTHMKKGNGNQENLAVLTIDNYNKLNFSCTEREACLILDWRECLFEIFNLYTDNLLMNSAERECMFSCYEKFVPVLKEVLETPQVPFTKGQAYEFVNNELTAKELW